MVVVVVYCWMERKIYISIYSLINRVRVYYYNDNFSAFVWNLASFFGWGRIILILILHLVLVFDRLVAKLVVKISKPLYTSCSLALDEAFVTRG